MVANWVCQSCRRRLLWHYRHYYGACIEYVKLIINRGQWAISVQGWLHTCHVQHSTFYWCPRISQSSDCGSSRWYREQGDDGPWSGTCDYRNGKDQATLCGRCKKVRSLRSDLRRGGSAGKPDLPTGGFNARTQFGEISTRKPPGATSRPQLCTLCHLQEGNTYEEILQNMQCEMLGEDPQPHSSHGAPRSCCCVGRRLPEPLGRPLSGLA